MVKKYTVRDVLNVAIESEETGLRFYRKLSEIADDEDIKAFFTVASVQEAEHAETYRQMLTEFEAERELEDSENNDQPKSKLDPIEGVIVMMKSAGDEVTKIEQSLFGIGTVKQFLTIGELAKIIDILVGIEQAAIDLFGELKNLTISAHRSKVEAIINEEREHLRILLDMRNKYKEGEL